MHLKHLFSIGLAGFSCIITLNHASSETPPARVQSTDKALLTEKYTNEIGAPIASPTPIWWPLWQDVIKRARTMELRNNDGRLVDYRGTKTRYITPKDDEYQWFYINHGPLWRDGDLEVMASIVGYDINFVEMNYCDAVANGRGNTDPFAHCLAGVSVRDSKSGEIRNYKSNKKTCNAGGIDTDSGAQNFAEINRKNKTVTFNATRKGKVYSGCKVVIHYQ